MPEAAPSLPLSADRAGAPLLPARIGGLVFETAGMRLLGPLDLDLGPGTVTVLMGPNGAGKSLLLRLLHGLVPPTSGTILWGGAPPTEPVRRRQAMVFQSPVLLRRSVAGNIAFALSLRPGSRVAHARRLDALLDMADLTPLAHMPARRLSGGEQQRLALARALALDPEVLLLDEPTASLDPAATLAIERIVRQAHDRGTKIVFVTHDIGQAGRLADEVVFLHRGRITEHTPADAFFDRPASREARDYLAGRIVL